MISKDQQFELAHRQYKKDIRAWARGKWKILPGWEQSDLEAEIMAVLWKAVETYDPRHGSKFANYFRTLRDRRYTDLIRKIDAECRVSEKNWMILSGQESTDEEKSQWTTLDRETIYSRLVPSAEEVYLEREESEELWRESRRTA